MLTIGRVLAYIILLAALGVFAAAADANPTGNITIKWDVVHMTSNGYDVYVKIHNLESERHVEKPGWQLSWTWPNNEVIWSILGAEAAEQGDCLGFLGDLPHSCEKSPRIIDLLPTASANERVNHCCRDGTISSLTQNKNKSLSEFQMFVGINNPSPQNISLPSEFDTGVKGYSCGPAFKVPPTKYLSKDSRRHTQSLLSWQVVCTYKQPHKSSCCVSFSTFYSASIATCETCSCGCGDRRVCQSSPKDRNVPIKCTSHMCPISIHWHVKESYKGYWLVKLTVTNYNLQQNYTNWNMLIEHPNLRSTVTVFDFLYSSLNEHRENNTWLFWGKEGYGDLLSSYQQSLILMKKEEGVFDFHNGWVFPRSVHFNGDSCSVPLPSDYPKLPEKPKLFPVVSSWILIFLSALIISFTLLYIRQHILGDDW